MMDRQLSKAVFGLLTVIELLVVIEFIAGPLLSYQQRMLQEHSLVIIPLIMLLKIVEWHHQPMVGLDSYLGRAFENFGLFLWATSFERLIKG